MSSESSTHLATRASGREPLPLMWKLLAGLCVLLTASWTFLCYAAHFNNYERDMLSDAVYYRTDRPLVYRTLLPTTVNLLSRLVPENTKQKAVQLVKRDRFLRTIFTVDRSPHEGAGSLKLEINYPVETAIALVLMVACLLGFLRAIVLLYDRCYSGSPGFRAAVPSVAAAGIVPWLSYTSHPYDLVSLFLSALSFLSLAQHRWRQYLLVFLLSCINKETAILNTLVFITYFAAQGILRTRLAAILISAQLAIYAAVKGFITFAFRANNGTVAEFHLLDINIPILRSWIGHHYNLEQLVIAGILISALFFRWHTKPLVLRCGLILIFPLSILGLLFGVLDEWRAHTDLYTPLLLMILGSVGFLFGVRPAGFCQTNR
ncbi:MAG: hypothetical protein JWO80_3039 [Bryobacterales bacterium]|nr:hypothetical protein [Bryobacterales bacterium]